MVPLLLFIITLAVVSIAGLILFFIYGKTNRVLSNRKAILIYLCVALVISACGFVGKLPVFSGSMLYFVLLQLFFLGLGFLVFYLWRKNTTGYFGNSKSRVSSVLFVLVNAMLGMIGFALVFHYCNPGGLAPYYALSVVPFVLPQFLETSFAAYRSIPQEIHKVWYYPVGADEIDFEGIDTSTIYMLELEYSKSVADPRLMNTKLRAPVGMKFGDWFRSFIENYNQRFDEDPIHYLNDDRTPQGWIFYVKPSFIGTPRFIDPDKTIAENKLVEKRAIIVKRVGLVEEEGPEA